MNHTKVFKPTLVLFILTLISSFFIVSYADPIYSWQDKNGATVYSNEPNPKGKLIKLKPLSSINTPIKQSKHTANKKTYDSLPLSISYPTNNQNIQNPSNSITLIIKNLSHIMSETKEDNTLIILVDQKPTPPLSIYGDMIDITTPAPGQHTLQIKIENAAQQISETPITQFFIQKGKRKSEVGTSTVDTKSYNNSTDGKNINDFYKENKSLTEQLKKQKPYRVQGNWKAYGNQVSPIKKP